LEFFVVDGGDEEEAQAESAATISLSMAMTFSQGTRSLEMSRFLALSLADNGFFLLRFLGMFVLACALCRP
jgi:hypothetical protein